MDRESIKQRSSKWWSIGNNKNKSNSKKCKDMCL